MNKLILPVSIPIRRKLSCFTCGKDCKVAYDLKKRKGVRCMDCYIKDPDEKSKT